MDQAGRRGTVLVTAWVLTPESHYARAIEEAGYTVRFAPWHGGRTEEEMIDLVRGIDAAIVSVDPFTSRVLAHADRLKVISRTGVGYDAIDVPAATERGVLVCIARGSNDRSVAQYAMALLLACARGVLQNHQAVREGRWDRVPGDELTDRTLGIIGLGAIGKRVAVRARAFEMEVVAHDIVEDRDFAAAHGVRYLPLEEVLRVADYVTLHCALTPENRHLINAERLALMKPGAWLINTARGGLVDEAALYQALTSGRLAGAALDVFEREPPWGSPLLSLPNVILAPHVAGITRQSLERMVTMAVESTLRVLRGEPPLFAVNPEAAAVPRPTA